MIDCVHEGLGLGGSVSALLLEIELEYDLIFADFNEEDFESKGMGSKVEPKICFKHFGSLYL